MEAGGGTCTVQGSNCSFKAEVKTRFAMAKEGGNVSLNVAGQPAGFRCSRRRVNRRLRQRVRRVRRLRARKDGRQ